MGCRFPGAPDLSTYWRNIVACVDAITDAPADRWDPVFYQPGSTAADRVYCRRGGFLDSAHARFDAAAFGVMPVAAAGAEPDQLLALAVARDAVADAGLSEEALPGLRGGVVLGRGGYLTPGLARLDQRVKMAEQLMQSLASLLPHVPPADLAAVRREFQGRLGRQAPDTVIGLVPNLAASRLANRLDLRGPAYTVDAACASSLLAVDSACRELADRRCDVVLAGGVHVCHDITFWSAFCQLGAVSRSEQIRPFDRRADGLLIGEGVGILVLKRADDARRDGDRIYAVIRGTGVASDGREASLMAPRADGQMQALDHAWRAARVDPATVGLVEAHGTGTAVGDATELETLGRFFGTPGEGARAGLGSVKSMIGHAMPAAGAASLIKTALALWHRTLPPTLHCEEPLAGVERTRFRLITRAEPWESPPAAGTPGGTATGTSPLRRAGVNAFGFGGINAHVVLEESGATAASARRAAGRPRSSRDGDRRADERAHLTTAGPDPERMLIVAAADSAGLLAALALPEPSRGAGPARLAIIDPTPERIARARAVIERGRPWRGREDIWFAPRGLAADGGQLAFLFPGVEAAFEPRVEDVAAQFGLPVPDHLKPRTLEETGYGIVGVSRLLHRVLGELNVHPVAIGGHSIGEWSGMIASGMIPPDQVDAFVASLSPGSLEVPGVVFAAVGCGATEASPALVDLPEIGVSHDNCPHQAILCGREDSIDAALRRIQARGVFCQKLSFKSGYHSPLFEGYLDTYRGHLARMPLSKPAVPLWSATTCAPYPADADQIRALAIEHLIRPVRFRGLCEALYDTGVRIFVEVGAGNTLTGFLGDTLRGRPHLGVASNVRLRSGLAQLRRLACALYVEGVDVALDHLAAAPEAQTSAAAAGAGRPLIALALGAPLVPLATPLPRHDPGAVFQPSPLPPSSSPSAHLVLAELEAMLRDTAAAGQDVVRAWQAPPAPPPQTPPPPMPEQREPLIFSIDAFPALLDHCFYRQPLAWPSLADRYPTVPMTMSLSLMLRAAARLCPDLVPIAAENVRALRWIPAAPPTAATVITRFDGRDRVDVAIEGFARATIVMGRAYPAAPPPDTAPLADERPAPITARDLYDDRWMFHGPRFQGVVALGPLGSGGVRGVIEAAPAEGALLDNAGQLFGYWVMATVSEDRLAMPVRLERVSLYGPHPAPGERVDCTVRIRHMGPSEVRADLELACRGRVWARIAGWEDRRFESDDRLWATLRYPERNLLAQPCEGGPFRVTDAWRTGPSRDLLARRYLGEAERAEYEALNPRRQGPWLNGRIAVKDALRHRLWSLGYGPMFPAEIQVQHDAAGRPTARGPYREDLRVSLAHKEGVAVALVGEGHDVGIDVERIEARGDDFVSLALTDGERALIPEVARDAWLARMWTAKEAVAKAKGTGLGGDPRRFPVVEIDGQRLLVDGRWVETRVDGVFAVGWLPC